MPQILDRLQTLVPGLNRVQDRVQEAVSRTSNEGAIQSGHLLENVELSTGTTEVAHRLGRSVQGALVVFCDAPETINITKGDPEQEWINVESTGPATVSIWVF